MSNIPSHIPNQRILSNANSGSDSNSISNPTSAKTQSVFFKTPKITNPSPSAIAGTPFSELGAQKALSPTPFATIEIEAEDFKSNFLNRPNYEFDITINGKRLHLQGGGVADQDGRLENTGTFGRIFKAIDPDTGKLLAIKVARPSSTERFASLQEEAKTLLAMKEANYVIGASVVGFEDDLMFAVMEYIEGPTLIDRLCDKTLHPLNFKEIISIFLDIAKGIEELHALGFAHRDIKMENIILQSIENPDTQVVSTRARVVDLGFAKKDADKVRLFEGTPPYLPPEILSCSFKNNPGIFNQIPAELKKPHTTAVDIYSFGALMYMALQRSMLNSPLEDSDEMNQRLFSDFQVPENAFEHHNLDRDILEALQDFIGVSINSEEDSNHCMSQKPENRPNITDVIVTLKTWRDHLNSLKSSH